METVAWMRWGWHSELEEMRERNEELAKLVEDLQAKYQMLEGR